MTACVRGLALAAGLAVGVTTAMPVVAATCVGVDLPDTQTTPAGELVLNGTGVRKATLLKVKVYVAGLYLPEASSNAEEILAADQAWRLELHFVRDVSASDMREAIADGFEEAGAAAELQPNIDALIAMLGDFKEGQTLAFTYDPAQGLDVALDAAAKGSIEGADFAAALLAIWLGPKPPNADLKSGLLGGSCG